MRHLTKPRERRQQYDQWRQENQKDLNKQFQRHLDGLTRDWIAQKNRVKVQDHLFPTSFSKCAYCEVRPIGGSLHIDHFLPKKQFPDFAFAFGNLVPACKNCNTVKVDRYGIDGQCILHPYFDNPPFRDHLSLNRETMMISGRTGKGNATVEVLAKSLNQPISIGKGHKATAVGERLTYKALIERKLKKCDARKDNIPLEYTVEDLTELINEVTDEAAPCTATQTTVLLESERFKALMNWLAERDADTYQALDQKAQEGRRKYCLHYE